MNWLDHHRISERLVSEATTSTQAETISILLQAAQAEERAFRSIPEHQKRTRGIIAVSATVLYRRANAEIEMERFAAAALSLGLPEFAESDLLQLRQEVREKKLFQSVAIDEVNHAAIASSGTARDPMERARSQIQAAYKNTSAGLDLSNLQLTSLPQEFKKLRFVQSLDLSNNSLSECPPELEQLKHLRWLNLNDNRISQLDLNFEDPSQLTGLQLAGNRLSSLPSSLSDCSRLRAIHLNRNLFERIPDVLFGLENLEILNFQKNDIGSLPHQILDLSKLRALFLHDNPKLKIPRYVLGPDDDEARAKRRLPTRPMDILNFYFSDTNAAKPLDEVKLILVGRGGAGKTTIRSRLVKSDRVEAEPTRGLDIVSWKVRLSKRSIKVNIWDFAGQGLTHGTHQFFMTARGVYLLVLEGRYDTQDVDAEYWLRLITAVGEGSKVIVILNKISSAPFDVDRNALRERYPFIVEFVETDCVTSLGIESLARAVADVAASMDSTKISFPVVWKRIRDTLSTISDNYLSFEKFRDLCRGHGESDHGRQEMLARILHELGLILHYAEDPRLRDTTILNPYWVTDRVYRILTWNAHRGAELNLGEAEAILREESVDMVKYIIRLLRRFELCFPIDAARRWLVPQWLSKHQPAISTEWNQFDAIRFEYSYSVVPEGLLPRFITRTYTLSDGVHWRNGVVLRWGNARGLIRGDKVGNIISVSVIGDPTHQRELAKIVRHHFARIHQDLSGFQPREWIRPSSRPDMLQAVDVLLEDERRGQQSMVGTADTGTVFLNGVLELNRISNSNARINERPAIRAFLSYAEEDAVYKDHLDPNLALIEEDGLVAEWLDCPIPTGSRNEEVRREVEMADVIVVLVSKAFLKRAATSGEMHALMERAESGEADLIQIKLDDSSLAGRKLRGFPAVLPANMQIGAWRPSRDGYGNADVCLRKLFAEVTTKKLSATKN